MVSSAFPKRATVVSPSSTRIKERSGFAIKDYEIREFIDLIYRHSGIVLTPDKESLITSRLHKRLKALDIENFSGYLEYIKYSPGRYDELIIMVDEMTTNKTEFFRESHHFDFLISDILPKRIASQWSVLNVWSAGCSTGEEPYTLAMILAEYFGSLHSFNILATDISTQALQAAHRAIYPNNLARPIPASLRKKYTMTGRGSQRGNFRIVPELRDCVTFKQVNLIDYEWDVPEGMDIIFCRNVMIYFDAETRNRIIGGFSRKIKNDGHLFIGHCETLGDAGEDFSHEYSAVYSYHKQGRT